MNDEAECDYGIPTSLDDVRAEDAEEQSAHKLSQADKDAVHADLHGGRASFKNKQWKKEQAGPCCTADICLRQSVNQL